MNRWQPNHPDEGDLLRYADGELPPRQARRIQAHLAACWQCRAAHAEIERTISECVRYRQTVLQSCLPEPPAPWADIHRRFAALHEETESQPLLRRIREQLRAGWLSPQRVAVGAVLAALVWAQATLIFRGREPVQPSPVEVAPSALPPPAVPKVEPLPPVPAKPAARTIVRQPIETATPGDELQVFALLRRLGADLGEPVEVTRQAGQVVVSGTGISPEIEDRIHRELQAAPRVTVQFTAPPAVLPPPAARAAATPALRPDIVQFQAELEDRLGGRAAYDEFTNDLLEASDALLAHLHALRRLAERFPAGVEVELTPGERRLLANLRRDHAGPVARLAAALDSRARPIFAPGDQPLRSPAPPPRESSWQAAAEDLLRSARRAESLLAAILGGTAMQEPARALPGEFLTSLTDLRSKAEAFMRDTAE